MIQKRWTQEEESLLIKLKDELGYTFKQISIEIGRSAGSCIKKYYRLTDLKYIEKEKQYKKQYYQNNKNQIAEQQKKYYQNNKNKIAEYYKKYTEDNRDQIAEYQRNYYQDNREKKLEYAKQYREDNKDKIRERDKQYYQNNREKRLEYKRNYHAQNPHKTTRKERYNGEFADIKLCHEFYKGISPITGTKDDLQVHHLINIKNNQKFWESATDEEKINYLILIPKDLHMAYHSWLGGTKVEATPESFWEFIDTIYFNEK